MLFTVSDWVLCSQGTSVLLFTVSDWVMWSQVTSVLLFTVSDWVLWGQVTVCIVIYCFRLGIVESGDCVYCYLLFQTGYCEVR